MKKQASSADRHQAVVKGQENLIGIKEFRIKRVLKQNEEGDYIVTESARSEMLYDSVETAEDAYKNIKDAQEEAEFDENGEDMEFNKDAGLHFGMSVKGCYVGSYDPLTNKYEIHNEQGSTHIDSKLLNIAATNKNIGICVKCGAIYTVPPADLGMGGISQTEPKYPTDFSKGGASQARDFCPFCGTGVQPDVLTPSTFTQDTYDISHGHKLPGVGFEQNHSSLLQPGFNVSPLEHELQLGVNRELEHVNDPSKAVEISLDHLAEDEDYYTKLNKVMPESGPEHKQPRILNIKEVEKEHGDDKGHNDPFETDIDGIISHAAAEYGAIMKKALAESDETSNNTEDGNTDEAMQSNQTQTQPEEQQIKENVTETNSNEGTSEQTNSSDGIDKKEGFCFHFSKVASLEDKMPYLTKSLEKANISEDKRSNIITLCNKADPTGDASQYTQWILNQFIKGNFQGEEDVVKYQETLQQFNELKNKKKIQPADINQYRSYGDLAEKVDKILISLGKATPTKTDNTGNVDGIEKIDQDGDIELFLVNKYEAARKEFATTKWCVKEKDHYDDYADKNPNFYLFKKNGQPYLLLHETDFKDVNNVAPSKEHLKEVARLMIKYNLPKQSLLIFNGIVTKESNKFESIIKKAVKRKADSYALLNAKLLEKGSVYEKTALNTLVQNKDYEHIIDLISQGKLNGGIQAAINAGMDVNAKDEYRCPILIYASQAGSLEVVQALIAAGADVNAKNEFGWTALMVALDKRNLEIAKELINAGADINAKDNKDKTILMYAAQEGYLGLVKTLIDAGADVNAQTKGGDTIQNRSGDTALIIAVSHGLLRTTQTLIQAGANIDATNDYGDTALIIASINFNLEIVKELIKAGADPNIIDNDGWTALDLADDENIKKILQEAMQSRQQPEQTETEESTNNEQPEQQPEQPEQATQTTDNTNVTQGDTDSLNGQSNIEEPKQ